VATLRKVYQDFTRLIALKDLALVADYTGIVGTQLDTDDAVYIDGYKLTL